jgi:hypothetical protein
MSWPTRPRPYFLHYIYVLERLRIIMRLALIKHTLHAFQYAVQGAGSVDVGEWWQHPIIKALLRIVGNWAGGILESKPFCKPSWPVKSVGV